jgi:hypothetical protein
VREALSVAQKHQHKQWHTLLFDFLFQASPTRQPKRERGRISTLPFFSTTRAFLTVALLVAHTTAAFRPAAAAASASAAAAAASSMAATAASTTGVLIRGAGEASTNGLFTARSPTVVPNGFARTCDEMGWPSEPTWKKLSDAARPWYEHENEAYIYWNRNDGRWWIDVPSGAGAYIAASSAVDPPSSGWKALPGMKAPMPVVTVGSLDDLQLQLQQQQKAEE